MYPQYLEKLIENLKILPGVGEKTAERYALFLIEQNMQDVQELSKSLVESVEKLRVCDRCHNLTDKPICDICSDDERDKHIICVVATSKEAFSIEKTGSYNGVYHVLDGLISSKKGVMPDDINISSLLNRLDEETEEVILALNATVEGEMTSLYLSKKIPNEIPVTRLAFGLPIGGHLDYADEMTLMKAFEGRNRIE